MQIQQSLQNIIGTVQAVPPQVLAGIVVGQQIEAAVIQASLAAQIVSLRIGENVVQVTTPVPLKQGQTVQLELVQSGDKPVLKLIPPTTKLQSTVQVDAGPIKLAPGQQVSVEIVKLLAENRLLVQATDLRLLSSSGQPKPVQFDVDVAQIKKSFTLGEKVLVEIVSVKPLSIVLKADPVVREQLVIDKIKQLLPQLDAKPQLAQLSTALKGLSLPSSVQGQIQQLVAHILDKQAVNQPQALKQAIESSGNFTERQLLKPNVSLNSDFKANLLKVAAVIVGELAGKPVQLNTTPTTSLSTGSLGKSQLASPNNVSSNPIINNKIVVNNGGDIPIKGDTFRPSFSLQNNTKAPGSSTQVKVDTVLPNTSATSKPSQLAISVADGGPRLTLLSAIFQAMGAHNTTPNSVSVLTASPSAVGLPSVLPAFLESVLTSQQAMILAQALNKSISVEQLRASGQFDVLVLQGLLKEVESLHARVQLNQFSMLKDPDLPGAPTASWLIDLPIKDKQSIDFIQLQIDQFKDQDDDKEDDIWSVQLRLDTQNLGPLQATVTMQAEDIKIVLRAERPESALLLDNHISWLHNALVKLGVSVSHVICSCGPVVKPTLAEQYLAETSNLVDVSV